MIKTDDMKICKEPNCGRKHRSLGFCDIHYKRFYRYGDPTIVKSRGVKCHTAESRAKIAAKHLGKPKSIEARKAMSISKTGCIPWNKGIKTGPLSDETRTKMNGRVPWNKGAHTGVTPWLGKNRGPMPAEWKTRISVASKGKPKSEEHTRNILANRWHGPRPEYAGVRFRSSYEVRVAKAFDARGIRWEYEPKRFNLGTCSYLPDFYLPEEETYWEVKGYFSEESQSKVRLFRKLHPDKPLIVAAIATIKMMEEVYNGSRGMEGRIGPHHVVIHDSNGVNCREP